MIMIHVVMYYVMHYDLQLSLKGFTSNALSLNSKDVYDSCPRFNLPHKAEIELTNTVITKISVITFAQYSLRLPFS